MKFGFSARFLLLQLTWALGAIVVGLVVGLWAFALAVALGLLIGANTRCNVCRLNVAANRNGIGRLVGPTCARCGASLERVYPFSYLKHSRPPA